MTTLEAPATSFAMEALMNQSPISLSDIVQRVEQLEEQNQSLIEALKFLLPMTISIPATTANSAQAVKALRNDLDTLEQMHERSEIFWLLAASMATLLSNRAMAQHPNDLEVAAIHRGVRQHRAQ